MDTFTQIDGPAQCHRQFDITDAASHLWAHSQFLQTNKLPLARRDGTAVAMVSHGRWIVTCRCGSGAVASRVWNLACCFGCGLVYIPEFPDNANDVERILLHRDRRVNQNWTTETVDELMAENRDHRDSVI